MIVMIVAEQDRVDRWEVVERRSPVQKATRAGESNRARLFRPNSIGQTIQAAGLYKHAGVPDDRCSQPGDFCIGHGLKHRYRARPRRGPLSQFPAKDIRKTAIRIGASAGDCLIDPDAGSIESSSA
jgi:hypothetical protein